MKWKKPSRPMGVPVWSHDGNICIGESLKSAIRLTFPKGALLKDPKHVFNTRLDSATVRAGAGFDVRPGGRGGAGQIGGHLLTVGVAERRAGQAPLPRDGG